tara:strand:- start:152 stop:433 length:282 start_codon:yes stop_codon:yes gene_type:complete
MVVGIIYFEMYIQQAQSLKEKRSIIKSLKQRIRNKFNVSVSEVGYLDKWQRSAFGLSLVDSSSSHLNSSASKIESFVAQDFRIQVTHWEMRII